MANETVYYTKRFQVYSRIMATYFSKDVFKHYMIIAKSTYIMIRKSELDVQPDLLDDINAKFKTLYDYFD